MSASNAKKQGDSMVTFLDLPTTVTPKDLAKMLRITRRTIYHWIAKGKLPPPIKIGKSIRWRTSDIMLLVNATPERTA
jgi:excisionase family DNA binding protein